VGGVPIIRCSECPRHLADAAAARRRRGLPQRSPYSATCSDRCEERREARFRREAKARGYELAPGDWRCEECGCVAKEAVARRARDGRKLSGSMSTTRHRSTCCMEGLTPKWENDEGLRSGAHVSHKQEGYSTRGGSRWLREGPVASRAKDLSLHGCSSNGANWPTTRPSGSSPSRSPRRQPRRAYATCAEGEQTPACRPISSRV
jgi:hypothetical protein